MIRFDDFGLGDTPPETDIETRKPDFPPKSRPDMPDPPEKTIASLNLNVVAAEEGRLFDLLPPDFRYHGDKYPLPDATAELTRISGLRITRGMAHPKGSRGAGAYIRRCRDEAAKRAVRVRRKVGLAATARVQNEVTKAKQEIKQAAAEIEVTMSDFRKKALEATASLTDLYSLAKAGLEKVMKGYVEGTDAEITAPIFTNAAGKVLQQVAKLGAGMDPEGKDESEEAVFKEYEATRARLARSSGRVAPSKGDSEPH